MTRIAVKAPERVLAPFDVRSPEQVRRLVALHKAYIVEEHDRTGRIVHGHPVAPELTTYWLRHDGQTAGYCSIWHGTYTLELIYIAPRFRRLGLARRVFAELAPLFPAPMQVKSPLSPNMRALVDSLGLVSPWGPRQEQQLAHEVEEKELGLSRDCPHRRPSDPPKPCPRCYRLAVLYGFEQLMVTYLAHSLGTAAARAMERQVRRPAPTAGRRKRK